MVNKRKEPQKLQAKKSENEKKQFVASARYTWYSPFKLRPVANVIRGKDVIYALNWLTTYKNQRSISIKKMIESAVANAKHNANIEPEVLTIKAIKIDQGPTHRYFKPGAMGRAMVQRKRLSHLSVILETKA